MDLIRSAAFVWFHNFNSGKGKNKESIRTIQYISLLNTVIYTVAALNTIAIKGLTIIINTTFYLP